MTRYNEGELFGQYPKDYPHYLIIRHGSVPYQQQLQARYSECLRIVLSWDIDSFKDEASIKIDRTEWRTPRHDFLLGHLKCHYGLMDRGRFIEAFEHVARISFEVIESAVVPKELIT